MTARSTWWVIQGGRLWVFAFVALICCSCAMSEPSAGTHSQGAPSPETSAGAPHGTPTTSTTAATDCGDCWRPAINTNWQIQFTGAFDFSVEADVYEVDLFDTSTRTIQTLHTRGAKVICYIDAGSWENWRPDAGQFPSAALGKSNGWPGERWLDVRQWNVLGPILSARLDLCKAKGFDGVEFDNVDGYTNDTGFPLTYSDQLRFNIMLAQAAHQRRLAVGLKNDPEQVKDLVPYFDWAIVEQCFQYQECASYAPFISAGKAVLEIEYTLQPEQFCSQAHAMRFSAIKKHESLDAFRIRC